jgi:uncharacterized protein (TIGR03067 family)
MYARLTGAFVLTLALVTPVALGGRKTDDAKKLRGTWTLVSGEDQGKPIPPEKLKGNRVAISDKTIVASDRDNKKVYVMTYKLDPSQKPHAIDMTVVEGDEKLKGKSAKGIYELKGDTLRLAYAFAGARPTEFATQKGDKQLSFVLKRVKP